MGPVLADFASLDFRGRMNTIFYTEVGFTSFEIASPFYILYLSLVGLIPIILLY